MTPREAHAALLAELRRRLEVCEAQQPGPWRTTGGRHCHAIAKREHKEAVGVSSEEAFIYSTPRDYVCLRETWEQQIADAEGMAAQRTERPAELRAQIQIAELHAPAGGNDKYCAHCLDADGMQAIWVQWPCRTIAPLLAACGIEVTR